eukprot:12730215-Alexandrium_andersonii.AAC.1
MGVSGDELEAPRAEQAGAGDKKRAPMLSTARWEATPSLQKAASKALPSVNVVANHESMTKSA